MELQEEWVQVLIVSTGATSIWLSQDSRIEWRRWSSVVGLLGQPAWFWTSFTNEQWGIFALSFVYAAAFMRGFYVYWIGPWWWRSRRNRVEVSRQHLLQPEASSLKSDRDAPK